MEKCKIALSNAVAFAFENARTILFSKMRTTFLYNTKEARI